MVPRRGSSLPPWMKSATATHMAGGGVYSENTRMDSIKSRYEALNKHVSGVRLEDVMHVVGGYPCPVMTLYGNPHTHKSNGGYVAIPHDKEGVVYAMCAFCMFDRSLMKKGKEVLVDIVDGMENSAYPWVIFTEEGYPRIIREQAQTAAKTHTHPAKRNKKNVSGSGARAAT